MFCKMGPLIAFICVLQYSMYDKDKSLTTEKVTLA
jgi:hypothetical protein